MSKLSMGSLSFCLIKKYVIFAFKQFYSEYIVVGRDNIPTGCPIIFAPNHLNALMDAIAVHSIAPKDVTVTFLARSDIFKNKTAARFLNFIKIMPAFRMRDGVENLGKNDKIFERCVEILHQNGAIGIMPEGNQGEERKLRTFTKGIFRIAFAAQKKYGSQPTVKIIPIGIDFGDLTKFGKHVIINIGKPIEVSEYMISYAENPVLTTNEIKERLRSELSKITLNLDSEVHYKCFETATDVANTEEVEKLKLQNNSIFRFVARQKIAEKLVAIEKKSPEKIVELETLCNEYQKCITEINIPVQTTEDIWNNRTSLLLMGLNLLITLPIFIYGFILNFLAFFTPIGIRKIMKVEYSGFYSSIHFGLGVLTIPIFYGLQTALFYKLTQAPWWLVGVFFFSQYYFGKWAYKWYSEAKRLRTSIRFKYLNIDKSNNIKQLQESIIDIINE